MNKQHAKGAYRELRGAVKEHVGHGMGKGSLELRGMAERVQKAFGDMRDAAKAAFDRALSRERRQQ